MPRSQRSIAFTECGIDLLDDIGLRIVVEEIFERERTLPIVTIE
jgi:hypothetical protein